jgi:hypothetical protein
VNKNRARALFIMNFVLNILTVFVCGAVSWATVKYPWKLVNIKSITISYINYSLFLTTFWKKNEAQLPLNNTFSNRRKRAIYPTLVPIMFGTGTYFK